MKPLWRLRFDAIGEPLAAPANPRASLFGLHGERWPLGGEEHRTRCGPMTDELLRKVRTWLDSEGYPFELRVGRTLRDAHWDVFHGRHFRDPETGKLREIDVHAAFGPYLGNTHGCGMVSVHLVCECKVSQSKPWVVFTSSVGDDGVRLAGRMAPGAEASRALDHTLATRRRFFHTLCVGQRVGHALTRAFSGSKPGDPAGPYSAVLGALTAACALSAEHEAVASPDSALSDWTSIYLPTVIVDGPLFEFYLDDDGKEALEPCERVQMLTYHGGAEADPLLVQIVASSCLAAFAADAHAEAVSLAEIVLQSRRPLCES